MVKSLSNELCTSCVGKNSLIWRSAKLFCGWSDRGLSEVTLSFTAYIWNQWRDLLVVLWLWILALCSRSTLSPTILVRRNKHRKGNTLLWAMMDKINQITFHFFETLWCKQSVSACYSAKTTVWETINGKFIPPPEIKDGKMARFGASTLIWWERFCCPILFCPRLQVWKFLLRFLADTFPHICR